MENLRRRLMQSSDVLVAAPLKRSANIESEREPVPSGEVPFSADEAISAAGVDPPRLTFSSRDWTLNKVLKRGKRFQSVRRVSALDKNLLHELEQYEKSACGEPLIVENWHQHPRWPKGLFDLEWLVEHYGQQSMHCLLSVKSS